MSIVQSAASTAEEVTIEESLIGILSVSEAGTSLVISSINNNV